MNFSKILNSLSDKEFLEKKGSRRNSFEQFKKFGKGAAIASIPFGLAATSKSTKAATASMFNMSSAAVQQNATDVLNFALTLEYLEKAFYLQGLDSGVIPTGSDEDIFMKISEHENDHVAFLEGALGEDAIDEPEFDFTADGTFDPFNVYAQFLALSQGFEDTGVRAYKGQAGALANNNILLEYALQIHSVEARHAAQVRFMRGQKPYITQNNYDSGFPAAAGDPIYAGEQNTTQGGVELAGLFDDFGGADGVTEAFDEPLTKDEVLAIGGLFIV